jgi:hypothetical protein
MSNCCGGGSCGTVYVNEEAVKLDAILRLVKETGVLTDKEFSLLGEAVESHWMYRELSK